MKKIFIYIALLLFTISCTNLEEEILDEQDGDKLLGNEKNIESIVAPSYAHLRDLQSKGRHGVYWKQLLTSLLGLHAEQTG